EYYCWLYYRGAHIF
nr:immunoglobulin light chain junction region [Macaca mulatta]MOW66157.1 immunoglobulin light chain junction region [Macaca mulatta]MOW67367.1 immunoglobulin light chain junction region [Macaca mulatta]MOW67510.1 immunoglobulin light chain junction region [Macaca mulatta]MOW67996.1 immunoglobulin light chain junction region [Macaca mulatta]